MAAKGIAQRILEVFAVLAVLSAAVIIGLMVWSNAEQHREANLDPHQKLLRQQEAIKKALTPEAGPKIPATPTPGDNLILTRNTASASAAPGKSPVQPLPAGVRIKHLCTNANQLDVSPDGKWGVAVEPAENNGQRAAVWNLAEGKLVRYLSAEPGKGTSPYAGKKDANFGAKTGLPLFSSTAFSPSGQRFAAVHNTIGPPGMSSIYAWDVATGKLLCHYEELDSFGRLFLFATEDHLITSFEESIMRLDVNTGEADLLGPPMERSMVTAGAMHDDLVALAGTGGITTITLSTKELSSYPAQAEPLQLPAGLSEAGAQALAKLKAMGIRLSRDHSAANYLGVTFSPDGKRLIAWQSSGVLDAWDVESKEQQDSMTAGAPHAGIESHLVASRAGLLGHGDASDRVQFTDLTSGKTVTTFRAPFRMVALYGLSSTADRIALRTDQRTALVIDFPSGLPAGTYDLAEAIGEGKLPATR